MRFILFVMFATACSHPAVDAVSPALPTTTCGLDAPAPIEIKLEVKKPAKHVFDREVCR